MVLTALLALDGVVGDLQLAVLMDVHHFFLIRSDLITDAISGCCLRFPSFVAVRALVAGTCQHLMTFGLKTNTVGIIVYSKMMQNNKWSYRCR
jgi:hypothetical protein